MEKIYQVIEESLKEVLNISSEVNITPETTLESLNLDSTSILELLMLLEDNIDNLEINPEDLEPEYFETVGTVAKYILNNTKLIAHEV